MESKNALKSFFETTVESSSINNNGRINSNKPASPADSSTWSSSSVTEETLKAPQNDDETRELRRNRRTSEENVSTPDLYSTSRFSPSTAILGTSISPSLLIS